MIEFSNKFLFFPNSVNEDIFYQIKTLMSLIQEPCHAHNRRKLCINDPTQYVIGENYINYTISSWVLNVSYMIGCGMVIEF
jgi:hypothetical protein